MEYSTLLTFLLVAVSFGMLGFGVNRLLMPYRPNPVKNATYECGIESTGTAHVRYNVSFFMFALLYVVFAVEAAFLFPWAVVFRQISGFRPLVEALLFVFVLVLALAYAWKKGALKWD